jgi:DNA-binding transcriptional regulator YiaG
MSSELFRRGRLGMDWTQDALAQTIGVPLTTLRAWEEGELAIPPKVMAWVNLYVRNPIPERTDEEIWHPRAA